MSRENEEIVRAVLPDRQADLVELFTGENEAELEAVFEAAGTVFTDDFQCILHSGLAEEPRPGVRGLWQSWTDWLAPWESYRTEIEELKSAGDRVLVLVRDFGRWPNMETEIELLGSAVWTVRGGKIARVEFFSDRADAFEAAGLSE
jgi:ketosteroid isomerase-like protein